MHLAWGIMQIKTTKTLDFIDFKNSNISFVHKTLRNNHAKFQNIWPSSFRGEDFSKSVYRRTTTTTTDDGRRRRRTTEDGRKVIAIAHRPERSGELKRGPRIFRLRSLLQGRLDNGRMLHTTTTTNKRPRWAWIAHLRTCCQMEIPSSEHWWTSGIEIKECFPCNPNFTDISKIQLKIGKKLQKMTARINIHRHWPRHTMFTFKTPFSFKI